MALVRAMRTDEIAVANAKLAFLGGNLAERFGKTSNGCIKRVSYTEFTAGWARVVDGFLKPPEVDTALAFYQSAPGVKYVEGLLRRMRERQGKDSQLPEVPGKEDISAGGAREDLRLLEHRPRPQARQGLPAVAGRTGVGDAT